MPVDIKHIATRLLETRQVLAYSVDDVNRATGIPLDRLNAIEEGKLKPTGDEILILASFYDCDFRSLVDKAFPTPIQKTDILFRKHGESFSTNDRRAIQEFLLLCQIEKSLQDALKEKSVHFSFEPQGNNFKRQGQSAAINLRKQLGHKENEAPRDIYRDFRSIGIHIFRRRLDSNDISGLYIEDAIAGHCVLVNYNEDIYRQRFSVAHEVAHSIFDSSKGVLVTYETRSTKYDKDDLVEIRANSFASNYLLPITMLERLPPLDKKLAVEWAQNFRVSTAALAKALKDAGLADESRAGIIRSVRVPTDTKIDPEAPEHLTEKQKMQRLSLLERGLSDYYVNLCFEAHYNGHISTGRLVETLRVNHAELSDIAVLYGRTIGHGV